MTADMRRRQIAEAVSFLGLLQFSGCKTAVVRRLPYLFGEAVHVVPPCERLNTNFHSIIRIANQGDLGSCSSQLIYVAC